MSLWLYKYYLLYLQDVPYIQIIFLFFFGKRRLRENDLQKTLIPFVGLAYV